MDIDNADRNKLNRRNGFRIYEQVDLFYQKIKFDRDKEKRIDFDSFIVNVDQSLGASNITSNALSPFDSLLPDSHSQENAFRNRTRDFSVRCIARGPGSPERGYIKQDISLEEWNYYQMSKLNR